MIQLIYNERLIIYPKTESYYSIRPNKSNNLPLGLIWIHGFDAHCLYVLLEHFSHE